MAVNEDYTVFESLDAQTERTPEWHSRGGGGGGCSWPCVVTSCAAPLLIKARGN
jgi:hypothetical protein